MNIATLHQKMCKTSKKMCKEMAVLSFLVETTLRGVVPKVISVETVDKKILVMSYIDGQVPRVVDLTTELFYQLGEFAKRIHRCGDGYLHYGSFDEHLDVNQPALVFSEFIWRKIQEWETWHRDHGTSSFVLDYTKWLRDCVNNCRRIIDSSCPVFCHGDYDLKNFLVVEGKVVGFVDWEHTGVYTLEWELRKLSTIFNQRPELLESFIRGYSLDGISSVAKLQEGIHFMEAVDLLGHYRWCLAGKRERERGITLTRMKKLYQE